MILQIVREASQSGKVAGFGGENSEMWISHQHVGTVIGKGGETIRELQQKSGAHIQVCIWIYVKICSRMHRLIRMIN